MDNLTKDFLNQMYPEYQAVQPVTPPVAKEEIKPEEKPEVKESKPVEKVEKKELPKEESGLTKEYFFDTSSPVELNPVWGATRSALGLAIEDADTNEVSSIAKHAATLLQDDTPNKIFNFISKQLSKMPPNVGNPVFYLQKQLTYEIEKKMKGGRK